MAVHVDSPNIDLGFWMEHRGGGGTTEDTLEPSCNAEQPFKINEKTHLDQISMLKGFPVCVGNVQVRKTPVTS